MDESFDGDYVEHAAPSGFLPNSEGLKQFLRSFRVAFPDLRYTIEDTLAEGEIVAQRLTGHGTMQGSFLGMPATLGNFDDALSMPPGIALDLTSRVHLPLMMRQASKQRSHDKKRTSG